MIRTFICSVGAALLCLSGPTTCFGQLELSAEFEALLATHDMTFVPEALPDYRWVRYPNHTYQRSDFVVYSRKEKLQIRYFLQPLDTTDQMSYLPQLLGSRMVTHLARNEDESVISVHGLAAEQVAIDFRADWGRIYYFPPKEQFSGYQHCQMLVLYREPDLAAYVFLLFDDPPPSLNDRLLSLQFLE